MNETDDRMPLLTMMVADPQDGSSSPLHRLLTARSDVRLLACVTQAEALPAALVRHRPDVLVLAAAWPSTDGRALWRTIPEALRPHLVVLGPSEASAGASIPEAGDAVLTRPVTAAGLDAVLRHVRERVRERRRLAALQHRLADLLATGGPTRKPDYVERLAVREEGRIRFVPVSAIDWVEADDNYAVLHAQGRRHWLRITLAELEQRLDPADFLRIHRSRIVNVHRVRELRPRRSGDCELILEDGTRLRSSRTYRDERRARLRPLL